MKQVFWFLCASIVPALIGGSLASVSAQTSSPTPDPFVVQITSNPAPGFNTAMGDVSANGRFVVFVSNGDVSTEKTGTRNNSDGNREIFLLDYAQRRIFQITDTKHVPNPSPSPTPTPSASPSPTPTPSPTPADLTQVKIEIDNRSPMISLAPALSAGQRVYKIVFSSNAPTPGSFDGAEGDLAADGNSEIWIYTLPAVSDVDLTLGTDLPLENLAAGTFEKVTNTTASRVPRAGSPTAAPFFADDNREPAISDDGNIIAFISTRDLVPGVGNTDANPELFFFNDGSNTFTQATDTEDATPGIGLVFQSNPSLSADGSEVSFMSSANLTPSASPNNSDGNAEVFFAEFGGGSLSNVRQVTRTVNNGANTNVASPGRRLSRNGAFIAFESRATDPKANSAPTSQVLGTFVYTVASDTFVEIGTRATVIDIGRFPTFTDYNASLAPSSLVFASALNFRTDGTIPAQAQASEGLNPLNSTQIFLTALPPASTNTLIRLTSTPAVSTFGGTRPIPSETRKRIAFTLGGVELGGGNSDLSIELFYLLSPQATTQSAVALSFFTGASNMPVAAATPAPSPTPSPTPIPSPVPGSPPGLAPGELSIIRSTVALAPSNATACALLTTCASETKRSPALPVELNGVSVAVNGAAAGLYFVGNAEKQINFVMPVGLAPGLGNVVVNILDAGANTDTILRGLVQIVPAQPDIFTSTGDAGGRAAALNAVTMTGEPFSVTTDGAPTVIQLSVTGVRLAAPGEITVTVGTTAISGAGIVLVQPNREMAGFDIINFTLPAALAGAGDVPIQVSFTRAGLTTVSRPAATAPRITIN